MTKILVMFMSAAVLATAMPARADLTWQDEKEICVLLDDALLTKPGYLTYWYHSPLPDNGLEVISAKLTVYAEGVDPGDKILISTLQKIWDPHVLGYLQPYVNNDGFNDGNNSSGDGCCEDGKVSATVFELDPEWLEGAKYVALVKGFTLCTPTMEATICRSVLDVTFVPAPGAALMGSVGLTALGWVKRRRSRR